MEVLRAFDSFGEKHFIRADDFSDPRKVRLRLTTRAGVYQSERVSPRTGLYLPPDPRNPSPAIHRSNIVATFPVADLRARPDLGAYQRHADGLARQGGQWSVAHRGGLFAILHGTADEWRAIDPSERIAYSTGAVHAQA